MKHDLVDTARSLEICNVADVWRKRKIRYPSLDSGIEGVLLDSACCRAGAAVTAMKQHLRRDPGV